MNADEGATSGAPIGGPPDAELLVSLYPRLIGYAFTLTRNLTDAQDIVQSSIVRYWRRSGRSPVRDPFSYVKTVITREYIRHSRQHARNSRPVVDADWTVDESQRRVDDRAEAADALACLTPKERAAIVARFYLDLSERATADALGCSLGAVKRYVFRARKKLEVLRLGAHMRGLAHSDD